MVLWQKTVAPFSEHKGGVGPFLKIPRSNSDIKESDLIHLPYTGTGKTFYKSKINTCINFPINN